jgi:hypothetical protein
MLTGGGATGNDNRNGFTSASNGHERDLENNLPKSNTPAKPPTPMPEMGSVKKYEITEVCVFDPLGGVHGGAASLLPRRHRSVSLPPLFLSSTQNKHETKQLFYALTVQFVAMAQAQLLARRRAVLGGKDKHAPLPRR